MTIIINVPAEYLQEFTVSASSPVPTMEEIDGVTGRVIETCRALELVAHSPNTTEPIRAALMEDVASIKETVKLVARLFTHGPSNPARHMSKPGGVQ